MIAWHKKAGDTVELDETIAEIGTDKVDTELPSPAAGQLQEILVQEGETVAVGTIIALLSSSDATATPIEPPSPVAGAIGAAGANLRGQSDRPAIGRRPFLESISAQHC